MNKRLGVCWSLFLLAGCAAGTENHYYQLTPVGADNVAFPAEQVADRHVTVHLPALLDRAEIVEATGPQTIAIHEFDRWAAPLDEMVPRVLGEDLAVARPGLADPDSRRIEVRIDDFIADTDGAVHLNGTWSAEAMRDRSSCQRSWRFAWRARADARHLSAVAASMSNLLGQLAETIARTD